MREKERKNIIGRRAIDGHYILKKKSTRRWINFDLDTFFSNAEKLGALRRERTTRKP